MAKFNTRYMIGIAAFLTSIPLGVGMAASDPIELNPSDIQEIKIAHLSNEFVPFYEKMEASGVHFDGESFLVVFDNIKDKVAKIHRGLKYHKDNGFIDLAPSPADQSGFTGYEGMAKLGGSYYALVETHEIFTDATGKAFGKSGAVLSFAIDDKDEAETRRLERLPLDENHFFKNPYSKGFEGVAFFKEGQQTYLLALCEGNNCEKSGPSNQGTILIYKKADLKWKRLDETISLTDKANFKDYSGLAVSTEGRIAIASQESSAIMIGDLIKVDNKWTINNDQVYHFPRLTTANCLGESFPVPNDSYLYNHIEGVDWINETTLVTVTDRRKEWKKKKSLPYRCKDQSIQKITIP